MGNIMKKDNIDLLYEQAWQYMRKNGLSSLGLDDRVYTNALSAIYQRIKENPLYCDDIMFLCFDRFLQEDASKERVDGDRGDKLIEEIKSTLELYKKIYYLLIPINGARLTDDISFGNFNFICGDEDTKEEKIIKISGLNKDMIHNFIDHTKKSRSKDFMEYPMVVLKIENVSSNVDRNTVYISTKIFQIIKLMVYYLETEEDIFEMTSNWYENNYHVAILGEEAWQLGHGCWWNLIQCKYSLDFLSKNDNQELFEKLVEIFIYDFSNDDLLYKFNNALELFERSLEQKENYRDDTLSTMLLFSAAESLLTENDNEKKLRLAVIWPRLVSIKGESVKKLGVLIRDAYALRNNFVHAGSLFDCTEKIELRLLHQMLAKLIMLYLNKELWRSENNNDKDITNWKSYIKKIFSDAIYC